jgi:hypothetical protein
VADRLRADGYTDQEIDRALTRAETRTTGKAIENLEAYLRSTIEDDRKRRRSRRRVSAQDYDQRDYSGVQAELEAEQDREMEEAMRRWAEEGDQP